MRTILLTLFTVLGLMLSQSMFAQTKTVTGSVTDAGTGETLPGVNVVIKNTTTGVSTDVNGKYSINVAPGQILVFTSIGYAAKEVTVGASDKIDVQLASDVKLMDEVVVVGYG